MRTVIQVIAEAIQARASCIKTDNGEWQEKWEERLKEMEERLPSGSGFDNGTRIDLDRSFPFRRPASFITLTTSYHHMSEHGYYTHWSEHDVIVRPAFDGIDVTIRETTTRPVMARSAGVEFATGELKKTKTVDDLWKDYAVELFHGVLTEIVEETT